MPHTETQPKTTKAKARASAALINKGKERLKIWEQAEGMWENRKPDPIKELNKIRKEMDRKLS
ncbi:MAG TPA: hypothetical protein VMO00_19600 [Methylomirabilota bacterium]|nr:hypothetical protein [Methylomirabilota bacterium]